MPLAYRYTWEIDGDDQIELPSIRTDRDLKVNRREWRSPVPHRWHAMDSAELGIEPVVGSPAEARHPMCWTARARADGPVAAHPRRTRSTERRFRMTTNRFDPFRLIEARDLPDGAPSPKAGPP